MVNVRQILLNKELLLDPHVFVSLQYFGEFISTTIVLIYRCGCVCMKGFIVFWVTRILLFSYIYHNDLRFLASSKHCLSSFGLQFATFPDIKTNKNNGNNVCKEINFHSFENHMNKTNHSFYITACVKNSRVKNSEVNGKIIAVIILLILVFVILIIYIR